MIIDNKWVKYYVPDDIGNNKNLSVAQVFEAAIPYDLYLVKTEIQNKQEELDNIKAEPDMIEVPNPIKEQIPTIEQELQELNNDLNKLKEKYGYNN